MKKHVLIGLGLVVAVIAGCIIYDELDTRRMSRLCIPEEEEDDEEIFDEDLD